MATISPNPFPEDGQRKLSTKEALQRVKALSSTLSQTSRPSCSGQVFVGIFFDGTGNNMKLDYELPPPDERKHSNIVKLFQTYRPTPISGYFRHYIPGVGTPFPEIGDNNKYLFDKNRGSIAADRGEDRIVWAFTRLINSPYQFVFPGAQLINDDLARTISNNLASSAEPAAMRRVALNTWQDKLKAALDGKKPRVEQINLSVFGFSRGAAEARAFVNWLFEVCKQEGGGWTFAGLPIRVQFLGIFDTVASVGVTNLFDNGVVVGHQSWADNNLEIHPAVEQCAHFVAGHEVRACFPLDSVRVKSSYPANAMEVMYPGAHSDVGGGYPPRALGVAPAQESFMSIIPGVNMYHEARKAGVPLLSWQELPEQFQKALTPSSETIQAFNGYLHGAKVGAGAVEEMHRRHMSLYFSFRFKHLSSGDFYQTDPYAKAPPKDKNYLYKTQRVLFIQMSKLRDTIAQQAPEFAQRWPFLVKYGKYLDSARRTWDEWRAAPSTWDKAVTAAWKASPLLLGPRLAAAKLSEGQRRNAMLHAFEVADRICVEDVTPEIESFLGRYVHDSMAGFIDMGMDEYEYNDVGIVKFRSVFAGND